MHRLRGWLPLVGWLGSLVAGIVLFTAIGDGPLEAPPLGTPSAWGAWAAERDGLVAAVALLRLVVLGLAWYLVAVTSVGLVARLTRAARLVRIADALSVPVVRHLLQGALGLTLAAGVVASSSGAVPAVSTRGEHGSSPAAVMTAFDGHDDPRDGEVGVRTVAAEGASPAASRPSSPAGTSRPPARMVAIDRADRSPAEDDLAEARTEGMHRVGGADRTTRMVGLGPPGASPVEVAGAAGQEDAAGEHEAGEHEVVAGEHLWSIAADHLEATLGRVPEDVEIAPHWERLVEINRDRLANPDDPDLIFPGQRLVLPDPPGEEA